MARFAAFFSDAETARAAAAACRSQGGVDESHCRLLQADELARLRRPDRRALALALLTGAVSGALLGVMLGGLLEVLSGMGGSARLLGELQLLAAWAGVGALAGAALAGWLARNRHEGDHERRFDRTLLRRVKRGDQVVLISGLPDWQLTPLATLLQERCERWCHDAGAQEQL